MQLIVQNITTLLIVLVSAYTDLRYRKVFNKYTIPSMLFGLFVSTSANGFSGFKSSLFGLFVGALILIIPFAVGGMGAGDVKLLAAIGAIKGWRFVVFSFVYAAIIGGVIAIIHGIYKRGIKESAKIFGYTIASPFIRVLYQMTKIEKLGSMYLLSLKKVKHMDKLYIPYAVPIAIGTILVLFNLIPSWLIAAFQR